MRKIIDAVRHFGRKRQRRTMSHGDLITRLIDERQAGFHKPPLFVETGSGVSTVALARAVHKLNGFVYSCDYNNEKVSALKEAAGDDVASIRFQIGDSLDSLQKIAGENDYLDFVFLDSAASAMHTFREFSIVEKCLNPGAVLLIDNAALPDEECVLSPVRKGKVLVPYLLASPVWEVVGYPSAGDSMVAAFRHEKPEYADPGYEHPEYVDQWKALFEKELAK